WSPANILPVGVNIHGFPGFDPHSGRLKILYLAYSQMPSRVHRGKHAEEFEGIDIADDAGIEQAIIHARLRRDAHPAAIEGSIGKGGKHGRPLTVNQPVL